MEVNNKDGKSVVVSQDIGIQDLETYRSIFIG